MQNGIAADYMICMEFPHWIFLKHFCIFFLLPYTTAFGVKEVKMHHATGHLFTTKKLVKIRTTYEEHPACVFEALQLSSKPTGRPACLLADCLLSDNSED